MDWRDMMCLFEPRSIVKKIDDLVIDSAKHNVKVKSIKLMPQGYLNLLGFIIERSDFNRKYSIDRASWLADSFIYNGINILRGCDDQ